MSPSAAWTGSTKYYVVYQSDDTLEYAYTTLTTAAPAFATFTIANGAMAIAQGGAETALSGAAADIVAKDQYGVTYTPASAETVTATWSKIATAGTTAKVPTGALTTTNSIGTNGAVTMKAKMAASEAVNSEWKTTINGTDYYIGYTTKWVTGATDGVFTFATASQG